MADEIVVVDHVTEWSAQFREEANRIQESLADMVPVAVQMGSTGIPGLCAKPVIDILVGVRDLDDERIVPSLESMGYVFRRDTKGTGDLFFRKVPIRTHHVHVVRLYSWDFWKLVIFRDYLVHHPSVCAQYGELKRISAEKYRFDRLAYVESKTEFIESVLKKATSEALITVEEQNTGPR
jgi:GrpB-like predicted nucleotidyltransferase (UPF0157 family)